MMWRTALLLSLVLNGLLAYSVIDLGNAVAEYRGLIYRCLRMYDKTPPTTTQRDNLPHRGRFERET